MGGSGAVAPSAFPRGRLGLAAHHVAEHGTRRGDGTEDAAWAGLLDGMGTQLVFKMERIS